MILLLNPAVCRMCATYELSKWPSLLTFSCSLLVKAPNWYLAGHQLDPHWGARFFSLFQADSK